MKSGRTNFDFQLNCDPNRVEELIKSYLNANGFKPEEKKGEKYYKGGDGIIMGYRYFNYNITGNSLTITAWFKGTGRDLAVDQEKPTVFMMDYRNSLSTLFDEINKLNGNGNVEGSSTSQPSNPAAQTFVDDNLKKKEKMAETSFWLSIVGLVCALGGVAFGALIYIIIFYLASQGMNTKKRSKAKTSIIITIISIVIIVLQLLFAN